MSSSIKAGSNGGDWGDANIWEGGIPDSAAADAEIAASGVYTVTISNESEIVHSATIDAAGANLKISSDGTLILAGSNALLSLESGTLLDNGGTLAGGTIVATGGNFSLSGMVVGSTLDIGGATLLLNGGTLADVTLLSGFTPFNTGSPSSDTLNIVGGLTATAGAINLNGTYDDTLEFDDSETLDNVTINIGDGTNYLYNYNGSSLFFVGRNNVMRVGADRVYRQECRSWL